MITIIIWIIVLAVLGLGLLLLVLFFPRLAGPGSIWLWVKYLGVIGGVPIAIGIYLAEWYYVASLPDPFDAVPLWFFLLMLWHLALTGLIWWRQKRPGSVRITRFIALWLLLGSAGLILQVVLVADDGSALGIATYVLAILGAAVLWWRIGPWLWGELKGGHVSAPSPLPRWNPEKGFSGQIFGDSANFIAVAAGIGSFNILSFNQGLWLLGLLSGFLALAVGLSLHYRWLVGMGPLGEEYGRAPAERWIAISSELVGTTTIVAGLVPKQETVGLIWPSVGFTCAIMLLAYIAVVLYWLQWYWLQFSGSSVTSLMPGRREVYAGFLARRRKRIVILVLTFVLLLVCWGVIIWFTLTSKAGEPPDGFKHVGNVLGLLAILCWIVAELFNTWRVTDGFMKGIVPCLTDYLSWEKSVWQIIGALIFMVYSALIALNPSIQDEPTKALFYYGVGLAGIGTIRGIIGGIINQMGKRKQEKEGLGQAPAVSVG